MNSNYLTISHASKILNVSIDTLRRWDKKGKLKAVRHKDDGYRYYSKEIIELYLKDIFALAKKWMLGSPILPESEFYCPDSLVFKARLSRLENDLSKITEVEDIFPLITAIVGEIGNNSYDHNLGNWPDIRGIFFAYDLNKKQIVLADRGRGILETLRKVKPELKNDKEALMVAFTEVISGRAPEARGNGLKFVKQVVSDNQFDLNFYTGDAKLHIKQGTKILNIKNNEIYYNGCISLIKY
ncbi:MAG: helix-turn-helix domain-containing protein [bacterium]|nr:helix-turn-helix domain-containing protein [bacterium]